MEVDHQASPRLEEDVTLTTPAAPAPAGITTEEDGLVAESNTWASPAFLRFTRSSLGPLADSAFDPFVEEDGYIPGRGRKRPRFSMRSNEWRLVDEPASPPEDRTAWNQTEELNMEDEEEEEPAATEQEIEETAMTSSVEPSADMKEIKTPERATDKEDVAPPTILVEGSVPAGAEVENSTQGTKEICLEHPPEQAEQRLEEPAHQHFQPETVEVVAPLDNEDRQMATDHIARRPTDTPRLLPLPSPGLAVPSPLLTAPTTPQGCFPGPPTTESNQNIPPQQTNTREDVAMADTIMESEKQIHSELHQEAERVPVDPGRDAASMDADVREAAPVETELGTVSQVSGFAATNERLALPSNIQQEEPAPAVESAKMHGFDVANEKAAETLEDLRKEEKQKVEDEEEKEIEQKVEEVEDEGGGMEREVEEVDEEAEEMEGELEEDEEGKEEEREEEEEEDEEEEISEGRMPSVSEERMEGDEVVVTEDDAEGEVVEEKEKEEQLREKENENREYEREISTRRHDGSDISDDEGEEDQDEELDVEEGYEEDYDSEHVYEEEYEGYPESESESEDENYPTRPQAPPPQRTVHPEVIVLDSDSDPEPLDATKRPQSTQSKHESVSPLADQQTPEQEEPQIPPVLESEVSDEEATESEEDKEMSDDGKQQEETVESESQDIAEGESDLEQERVDSKPGNKVDISMPQLEPQELVSRRGSVSPTPSEDEFHPDQKRTPQPGESAMDPELLHAGVTSGGVVSDADQESSEDDDHLEDRSARSQRSSDLGRQVEPGLLFDGAGSPCPDNETYMVQSHSLLKPRDQLITPNASQVTDIDSEKLTKHTVAEASMPTPQATQVAIDSSLQSQIVSSFAEAEVDEEDVPRQETIPSPLRQSMMSSEITSTRPENAESSSPIAEKEEFQMEEHPEMQESIEDEVALSEEDQSLRESDDTETPRIPPPQPNRHANGLRSQLSYFAPLATLIDHFNVLTDTISVVVETSPPIRARNGPKEYYLTLQLTDPSMAGTTLPAQIFRPFKTALPSAKEGDVILLRNFKVKSFNHSMMLLSSESSAWAVFPGEGDDALITGPPVEYGDEERAYAKRLQKWYYEDGAAMVADHRLQLSVDREDMEVTPSSSAPASEAGSTDSVLRADSSVSARSSRRGRKSHGGRRITIHELRDGTKYMEVGSPSDRESIHELRDGTIYANI